MNPTTTMIHPRSFRVLTSTDAIESASDAGNLALINLGPGAVIVGTISGN